MYDYTVCCLILQYMLVYALHAISTSDNMTLHSYWKKYKNVITICKIAYTEIT